ncbi:alkaline shock response membrane anchor protein AmaP [Actinomadura sp. LD22]|uniref:Alkaline shock response membrane anchor protein AmaP n=1 Tax=Actinomadura physcomitrii TaxID=2650748 RepID=A0A6I4MJ10_9ACTN|nr:alkaline shock response membrane anchor protein AmaP [Actinomadura physcomitrii]MWA03967.1 alkaline shock response membrane anchor protein AmaP [Actinomadura physcomitrii]
MGDRTARAGTDRRPAHLNRTGLVLVGALMVAAGGAGLARGAGAFGGDRAGGLVFSGTVRRYAADHGWFWPAVAAAVIVLALLGLAWLLAQGRTGRLPGLAVEPDPSGGRTRVSAKAVTDALEAEVAEYPGVRTARARLIGSSRRPELRLNVTYLRRADPAELRRRIEDEGMPRLATALGRPSIPAVVRLRLVKGDRAETLL